MTRMAPSTHSKRGPLRRTPVSVVLPEGPEIVHCEVEAVRDDSPFRMPQVNAAAVGLFAVWPWACPASASASNTKLVLLIWPDYAALGSKSLDHFVGLGADDGRERDAHCLCGLEVEHHLEPGGEDDRQIGWLVAVEHPPGIDATLAKRVRNVVAVADQAAVGGELTERIDRRQRIDCRLGDDLLAP